MGAHTIVLVDLDGTLVSTGGVGRRAMAEALEREMGFADALADIELAGNTDGRILAEVFDRFVARAPAPEEVTRVLAQYLTLLDALLAAATGYRTLPGVSAWVERLSASPAHEVGLGTGNIEAGARRKLSPAGLNRWLSFGGFGCDAHHRDDILRTAAERGRQRAPKARRVVVVGDTLHDVASARAIGAEVIGVVAGAGDPEALAAAQPDLLVDSLLDAAAWTFLGLDAGDPSVGDE